MWDMQDTPDSVKKSQEKQPNFAAFKLNDEIAASSLRRYQHSWLSAVVTMATSCTASVEPLKKKVLHPVFNSIYVAE